MWSAKGQSSVLARRKSAPLWNLLRDNSLSFGCPALLLVLKGPWHYLLGVKSVSTNSIPEAETSWLEYLWKTTWETEKSGCFWWGALGGWRIGEEQRDLFSVYTFVSFFKFEPCASIIFFMYLSWPRCGLLFKFYSSHFIPVVWVSLLTPRPSHCRLPLWGDNFTSVLPRNVLGFFTQQSLE